MISNPRVQAAWDSALRAFDQAVAARRDRGRAIQEASTAFDQALRRLTEEGEIEEDEEVELSGELSDALDQRAAPARPPVPRVSSGRGTPTRGGGGKPPAARDPVDPNLLTSSFRFVPLNPVVVPPERVVSLDEPLPGGFSGRIEVEWAAETPLLIGEERAGDETGPMRLGGQDGRWIIPGSTIRGCLRAAMEIVASGHLSQINAHHQYGLRDFDHPFYRPENPAAPSVLNDVHAGWLRRIDHGTGKPASYEIEPCADLRTIAIADLPGPIVDGRQPLLRGIRDQYQWREEWLKRSVHERYTRLGRGVTDQVVHFEEDVFHRFSPAPDGATGQLIPDPQGEILGTLVFSDRSPTTPTADQIQRAETSQAKGQAKKREYVFVAHPPGVTPRRIPVHPDAWRRFDRINSSPRRRGPEPDGSWAKLYRSLKRDGGRIPVFFARDGVDMEIGLTRFFKIAHKYSVGQMRDRARKHERKKIKPGDKYKIDFTEALFGHVFDADDVFDQPEDQPVRPADVALKGRLAFSHARLLTPAGQVEETRGIDTVLATPRASFAPFYLAGQYKDYSAEERETTGLAGRKRYFPRFTETALGGAANAIEASLRAQRERLSDKARVNEKTGSRLRLLGPRQKGQAMRFASTIRLHNVSPAEVGALLWTLTHGGDPSKPYRHLMGHARMFGAGQMRVCSVLLRLTGHDDAARALLTQQPPGWEKEGWVPVNATAPQAMTPFLNAFHNWMTRPEHRGQAWPNVEDMRAFAALSRPETGARIVAEPRGEQDGMARYPRLGVGVNEFTPLRRASKRWAGRVAPEMGRPLFLPAPAEAAATAPACPYREGLGTDRS